MLDTAGLVKDTGGELKPVVRTERGWPGHYICFHECYFRRNTLLECGDQKVVVSSVGNRVVDSKMLQEVGAQRYYETMVFKGSCDPGQTYVDADVSKQILVESKTAITDGDLYEMGDRLDLVANEMHEEVVKEIGRRMGYGEIFAFVPGDDIYE